MIAQIIRFFRPSARPANSVKSISDILPRGHHIALGMIPGSRKNVT